ncbi:MAG: tyrosine-protein phosphatase [Blastocatellia bacterium]|jgi:protein tyrosine/serine phosphatase|nr:tyrosine-protein phosphatase [Blastocatellia bacterium]
MFTKNTLVRISAILGLVLATVAVSLAKTHSDPAFANITIKNFGKMDARFYRGAQPKEEDYKDLKALGIKTIIDLQDSPTNYEKRDVEALGMRYVNIPMSDSVYPKEESISAFLKLINDPTTGVFFAHCAGGRHRTGVVGAIYRFNVDHWNYDQAYAEMKDYDFYTRWGHGDMKKYVDDYWQHMQANGTAASAVTSSTKQ